ncbi:MAG: glycosyltransferase family 2 protein [Candidatus Competibacterales bacterium]
MSQLAISLVTYRPHWPSLGTTLESLAAAIVQAQGEGVLTDASLTVVDNSAAETWSTALAELLAGLAQGFPNPPRLVAGHGNIGFGAGHNRALAEATASYVLVLNPDVDLERHALARGLAFMEAHPTVDLLTPKAWDGTGRRQYLCRRYPSVLTLALRGFAPKTLQRRFARRLAAYEMHDCRQDRARLDIPLTGGCFMLMRRTAFQRLGGFAEAFFLYFEDYDLCLRLRAQGGKIAYVPQVTIVHGGGGAARKGWRHRYYFGRSAWRFYRRHGWCWM